MNYPVDHDYLIRRYRESLSQALSSSNPRIAKTYREFASRYARALAQDNGPISDGKGG